ncbi:peptidoglycan recognition protein 4-like [Macrosteles quadrilineatus]|uniref:peptidoglycan recognition protein 4-like n=1 Tax=Macrosteles quadrilineatus TaxID=74068 RepID=UPI0023E3206B|nr:peptidoglycan recognition protein 4-like [Macrosteles quadrilineatus]
MPWPLKHPAKLVFTTDTRRDPCTKRDKCFQEMMQMYAHQTFSWNDSDIRYNFLIGGDNNIYEGRGWHNSPTVTDRYKKLEPISFMIGFFGKYPDGKPPQQMLDLAEKVIQYGITNQYISPKFLLIQISSKYQLYATGKEPWGKKKPK